MLNHGQKANNTIHSSDGYIEGQILKKAVNQNRLIHLIPKW